MNQIESRFLLAVEKGDIKTLKTLLEYHQKGELNINCCDPLARSALVIAIDNENTEIVKILIEAKVTVGDALLYAIDENFVEAVELLLDYELATTRTGEPKSWELDRVDSFYSADLTPLILAAHRNNFEVIKILIDRQVAQLPDPHDPRCKCAKCCQARSEDCLNYSRSRINAYRALASPCLMALSSPDPLLTAFKMSAKLESLAKLEPEYKQDYLRLRTQCQTFATKLLDHTRTSEELGILLNYSDEAQDEKESYKRVDTELSKCSLDDISADTLSTNLDMNSTTVTASNLTTTKSNNCIKNHLLTPGCNLIKSCKRNHAISVDSVTGQQESYMSDMRLARLRLAIQCKQKTFCAHPNIQELLATMWYENLPGFRQKSTLSQAMQIIGIGLLFPVYSIAYLVSPYSQLGRYIKKPFIKFICHSASYVTFLTVLILASQRVEAFYCWARVIGIFSDEEGPPIITADTNFTAIKQVHPTTTSFDGDKDLSTLVAFYKLNSQTPAGARGLDSLSKIFVQLPASSKRRGTVPSPIELVILVWVVSLIWAEIKQLKALGVNYYKADMWNALDSVASGFYIGTIILRLWSYLQTDKASMEVPREHWPAYDPTLLSEALFATATIFSSLKLVYIFSVNPYLGPLQISLGRMIIDILRFSWIYMLVLFSFAVGMNQLLWYYADLERHQCLNITNYNLAQYYSGSDQSFTFSPFMTDHLDPKSTNGIFNDSESRTTVLDSSSSNSSQPSLLKKLTEQQNMTEDKLMEAAFSASLNDDFSKPPITLDDSCKTWRHFSNLFESTQTLFWANFGLVDLENFDLTGIRQYTRFWALLMFGCYCFINVIVVLNLLIAMMNHSYVKISKKSDVEWKFARTRLWMSYFDTGSTVPAPFNILPSFKFIYSRDRPESCVTASKSRQRKCYQSVIRALVRRYLVNEQRLLERKRELTEAKLNRWANAFE